MEQKTSLRLFPTLGFIALVIFLLWLAVQVVTFLPSAFSSLASIADGLQRYQTVESIEATPSQTVVNSGKAFTLNWKEVRAAGTYTFMYTCSDDASVSIRSGNGVENIDCGTEIALGDVHDIDILVLTETNRFTDIEYTLIFTPERGDTVTYTQVVTVVNAHVTTEAEEDVVVEETEEPSEETSSTDDTVYHTPVEEVTYQKPVNDPNGYTDLAVSVVGTGKVVNGRFVKTSYVRPQDTGAIQFVVKNVGTRTSENWTYDLAATNGFSYQATRQAPLLPNEEATITIGLSRTGDTGVVGIGVSIDTDRETTSINNSFEWSLTITE